MKRTRIVVSAWVVAGLSTGVVFGHGAHTAKRPAQTQAMVAVPEPEQTVALPSGVGFLDGLKAAISTADAEPIDLPAGPVRYTWAVSGGQVIVHFNYDFLGEIGIAVPEVDATAQPPDERLIPMEPPFVGFAIEPSTTLQLEATGDVFRGFTGGAIEFSGGFTLARNGLAVRFNDFSIIEPAGLRGGIQDGGSLLLVSGVQADDLILDAPSIVDVDTRAGTLILGGLGLTLTESTAMALALPELSGQLIGTAAVLANIDLVALEPDGGAVPAATRGGSVDVKLGFLTGITVVGRTGTFPAGMNGLSMNTTSCNVGNVDVPWLAAMQENHPGIGMALFRVSGTRFEQVGMSWVKHGFFALSNSQCTPCQHPSDGTFLGVGCSDTYSVGNNASRNWLGPRDEWDPNAGTWECTGSHFDGVPVDCVRSHGSSGHDADDHMLRTADADLGTVGATYYYEAFYVVRNDDKLENNVGYRPTTMSWTGSSWSFSDLGVLTEGPAIDVYGDFRANWRTEDGRIVVASKVTDLGGGEYRYDYAVYSWTHNKGLRTFRVPAADTLNITNEGMSYYHDAEMPYPDTPWSAAHASGELAFATDTFADDPNANVIRWGQSFAFWFDCDSAPTMGSITMDAFMPSVQPVVTVPGLQVPSTPPITCVCADLNEDGIVNLSDFATLANCFSLSAPGGQCPAVAFTCSDLDANGVIDLNDFATFGLLFSQPANGQAPPNCLP